MSKKKLLSVCIRDGNISDAKTIASLIKELAIYEKKPKEAILTPSQIAKDGFGKVYSIIIYVA